MAIDGYFIAFLYYAHPNIYVYIYIIIHILYSVYCMLNTDSHTHFMSRCTLYTIWNIAICFLAYLIHPILSYGSCGKFTCNSNRMCFAQALAVLRHCLALLQALWRRKRNWQHAPAAAVKPLSNPSYAPDTDRRFALHFSPLHRHPAAQGNATILTLLRQWHCTMRTWIPIHRKVPLITHGFVCKAAALQPPSKACFSPVAGKWLCHDIR